MCIRDSSTAAQLTKTAETLTFYGDEVDRIAQQIAALEPTIATYKAAHRDALRQSPGDRQQDIMRLTAKISAAQLEIDAKTREAATLAPVSYTHLDVYKRQLPTLPRPGMHLNPYRWRNPRCWRTACFCRPARIPPLPPLTSCARASCMRWRKSNGTASP